MLAEGRSLHIVHSDGDVDDDGNDGTKRGTVITVVIRLGDYGRLT